MASAAGAADLRSTNVSVTAINVDNTDYYKTNNTSSINGVTVNITDSGPSVERSASSEQQQQHGGVVTSRSKDTINVITEHSTTRSNTNRHSDSDSEVAQIDFQSTNVNLRPKNGEGKKPEIPRPMSWEGELSDGESTMCIDEDSVHLIDNSQYIIPENLSTVCNISNKHQSSQQPFTPLTSNPTAVRLKQPAPPPPPVGGYSLHSTPSHSPLLNQRPLGHRQLNVPPTPSPDSAIHSAYSVFSSPSQSPITQRHVTSSLSRNNSDASHSSCCSYSSVSVSPTQQFSPTHSPIQGRHTQHIHSSPLHHNAIYRSIQDIDHASLYGTTNRQCNNDLNGETDIGQLDEIDDKTGISQSTLQNTQGISRQQLINSPCPICGDKISGFHYGIFSCESCKGFFKRTVQNRKNYVCLRGALCPVTVTTRKKCPACRFDKCLQCGMKLEAIREDRTRGGRSTYQCSYSIPPSLAGLSDLQASPGSLGSVKLEPTDISNSSSSYTSQKRLTVPSLLQEIMDVEHLWHYNEVELTKLSNERSLGRTSTSDGSSNNSAVGISTNPLLMNTKLAANANDETNSDFLQNLCNIADHRLYKIVKWCKSLPLFKNISIDDQICLLINSWCELLLFSCCFRSISTPGEIKVSLGKSINLAQAREMGLQACIERMLNFTEHLRRLRVDKYEYVAMKVIVLLTSDASELREPEKVRASQEKALQALQAYTLAHYPDSPAKFGELLLRIPDLQRTCQVGKEMLSIKSKEGEGPSFNLLMELLRGDH